MLLILHPFSFSGFQNKNRVAILAELDKEKRKLLMQNQSSTSHPGARYWPFLIVLPGKSSAFSSLEVP
jgi:hypothetical protein